MAVSEVPATRVLLVDDDVELAELVGEYLTREGFTLDAETDGTHALGRAISGDYQLTVLDVMLPGVSGFDLLRGIRAASQMPVLMLTARGDDVDRIVGLELGADDYLSKPFNPRELVARIRAILRRTQGGEPDGGRLRFEDLEMDEDAHEVWRAEDRIELTPTEFKLLRFLMLNPRRVMSKGQILDHVWEYDFGGDAAIVETYISYLRRKVDANEPHLIHTVRGVGYTLRLPRG